MKNIHSVKVRSILLLSIIQIYHKPANAFNFNFFKKKESQTIKKDIIVPKDPQIILTNTEGSYTIKPWDQQKVSLEVQKTGHTEGLEATTIKSKVVEQEVSIATTNSDSENTAQVHYTLRVPEDASIKIIQTKGPVTINGIEGDIDISLEQGSIDIKGSTKVVTAKTGNGTITVRQRKLAEPSSIFLQAHKGNVVLSLPRETRASLEATVDKGSITSEHPVTMTITTKIDQHEWDRLKKNISGVLGTFKDAEELDKLKGAPPITLDAARGNIQIKEA